MTKVALETVDPVRRRLEVEIPAGEVTAEIGLAYDQLRRKANVRGFRRGRAPRSVLERMFGDQIRADVFSRLVRESYHAALREHNIEPVSQPEIVTESAEPGEPLRYSAIVEVRPSVVATGYAGLDVERPLKVVDESEVDRFLERMRESFARLQPITDRQRAGRGDVATVDYEARAGDRLLGRGENRGVEIGAEQPEGLANHLDGAEVGIETTFEVDYPPDHSNPELAGQLVSFRATVKSLAFKELPPLDDEFARTHSGTDTLASLRDRVREQLEAAAVRDADGAMRANLIAQLVSKHDFEVPSAMVERRIDALVTELLDSMGPRRPPKSREADLRARLRPELVPRARDQVKASILLEAIASQEHLEISDGELEAQIDRLAAGAGSAGARVRALYQDPGARESLRSRCLQERALELVVERAKIETAAAL